MLLSLFAAFVCAVGACSVHCVCVHTHTLSHTHPSPPPPHRQAMSVVFVILCLGGELKIFVVRTHRFFLSVRPG
jgi:hypothetical protein